MDSRLVVFTGLPVLSAIRCSSPLIDKRNVEAQIDRLDDKAVNVGFMPDFFESELHRF